MRSSYNNVMGIMGDEIVRIVRDSCIYDSTIFIHQQLFKLPRSLTTLTKVCLLVLNSAGQWVW